MGGGRMTRHGDQNGFGRSGSARVALLPLAVAGCSDAFAPHNFGTTSGPGAETTAGETTGIDTGADTGVDETGAEPSCDVAPLAGAGSFAVVREAQLTVDVFEVCSDEALGVMAGLVAAGPNNTINPETIHPDDEHFEVVVYRPADGVGDWPAPGLPVVAFIPGNNQFLFEAGGGDEPVDLYRALIDPIVREGFVVIGVQPLGDIETSPKRERQLACALIWARDAANGWDQADDDRIGSALALMGHSRGGAASLLLTNDFPGLQSLPIFAMQSFAPCTTVAIAPRWAPAVGTPGLGGDLATDVVLTAERAVPYFVLQGAIDEDTIGQGISAYDAIVPEDGIVAGDDDTLSPVDKVMAWVYDVSHTEWGGDFPPPDPQDRRGVVLETFVPRFLRWQITKRDPDEARNAFTLLTDPAATQADFDSSLPDLANPDLWADAEPFYSQLGRPPIYADLSEGVSDPGSLRLVVDTLARDAAVLCGDGLPADFLSPSTIGADVVVEGMDPAQVCRGPAKELTADDPNTDFGRHESQAVRVSWGAADPGGALRWNVAADVSQYTHVDLRVGQVVEELAAPDLCGPVDDEPVELTVELETQTGTATASAGTSLQQHAQLGALGGVIPVCSASQFMHTVRIPMSSFCGQPGIALDSLEAVTLRFPDLPTAHRVLVDSIEFTRDPQDPDGTACGSLAAAWRCAVSDSFTANEVSCASEPRPACAPSDIVVSAVEPPHVVADDGTQFDGWIVHTPAGWIADPSSPSESEVDAIARRCVEACDLEWAGNSAIVAGCGEAGAFESPTLLGVPSLGARIAVADEDADGSGIFPGQALDCDVRSSCCEVFDEELCAAAPLRPTPATAVLGRGEEFRAHIGGLLSRLSISTPSTTTSRRVEGTAGYSLCPLDADEPCPFYLGSLDLSLVNPIAVEESCADGSTFSATLDALDLGMLQPAFGIDSESSHHAALPVGSLFAQAQFTAAGFPFTVRAVNEEPVEVVASGLGIAAGDIEVGFMVPCGSGTMEVHASFSAVTTHVVERPPVVVPFIPSSVQCGTTVPLLALAFDPDGDLASVRWLAGDVLLAAGTTSLQITQDHDLRVVVRDERGATRTKTRSITCW